MLLQSIVQLFDQELLRLHTLRDVVADLATPSGEADLPLALASLAAEAPEDPLPVQVAEQAVTRSKRPRVAKGLSRASLTRKPAGRKARAVDHGALTSVIPAGPVVVSADRLQVKPAVAKSRPVPPKEGTLGSMIRALHLNLPQE